MYKIGRSFFSKTVLNVQWVYFSKSFFVRGSALFKKEENFLIIGDIFWSCSSIIDGYLPQGLASTSPHGVF